MAVAKPVLGYASKTDAVLDMHKQGLSFAEIGRQIDVSPSNASALFRSGCRRVRRNVAHKGLCIPIPLKIAADLKVLAKNRGIRVQTLIVKILWTITRDDLIEAVLDDADGEAGQ